jgi:importin-7
MDVQIDQNEVNAIATCFYNININNNIKDNEEVLNNYKSQNLNKMIIILFQLINSATENDISITTLSSIYLKNTIQLNFKKNIMANQELFTYINEQIVLSLIKSINVSIIRKQLLQIVSTILSYSNSDSVPYSFGKDLITKIKLLFQSSDHNENLSGIYLTYELTKYCRYSIIQTDSNKEFEMIYHEFSDNMIPQIYSILNGNLNKFQNKEASPILIDITHYLIKTFYYLSCFNRPCMVLFNGDEYMKKFVVLLNEYVVINELNETIEKWCVSVMSKIFNKFSRTTKFINEDVINYNIDHIFPIIIDNTFKLINSVIMGNKNHLNKKTNYFIFMLFNRSTKISKIYDNFIKMNLLKIFELYLIPLLKLNEEMIDEYEFDPQNYINNVFHNESYDHEVISGFTQLIMNLKLNDIALLNEVVQLSLMKLQEFIASPSEDHVIVESYGGCLSLTLIYLENLTIFKNPSDIESGLIKEILLAIISNDEVLTSKPWFIARFLNCLSFVTHEYENMEILSALFERCYNLFINSTDMVIKVEALCVLRTVILYNTKIHDNIKQFIPLIVEKILVLQNDMDLEILSTILEKIIEDFHNEIKPFARELAVNLKMKFIKFLDNLVDSGENDSENSEYYIISLLNTMSTLVSSMTQTDLSEVFVECVLYIINNNKIDFMTETLELYQLMVITRMNSKGEFGEDMWMILTEIMNSFELYAMDYFQEYESTFKTLHSYGFLKIANNNMERFTYINNAYIKIMENYLINESDDDFLIGTVLDNLVYYTLGNNTSTLKYYLDSLIKFLADEDEGYEINLELITKGILANIVINPTDSVSMIMSYQMEYKMNENIFKTISKAKFYSLFSLKLSLLAFFNIYHLKGNFNAMYLNDFLKEMIVQNVNYILELPKATKKRDDLLNSDYNDEEYDEEDYDDFEGMGKSLVIHEEDTTRSIIDNINIFAKVNEFFSSLNEQDMKIIEECCDAGVITNLKGFLSVLQG